MISNQEKNEMDKKLQKDCQKAELAFVAHSLRK